MVPAAEAQRLAAHDRAGKEQAMMTDDLRQAVDLALKMARKDLEGPAKSVTPIFLLRDREGHIAQLPFPAEAARLMNYGEAKNAIFGYVREMIQSQGYTATVFATEAWYGKATEKGLKLDPKVLAEKCREPGFETAIREGLMERSEAVLVSVQTADRV